MNLNAMEFINKKIKNNTMFYSVVFLFKYIVKNEG